MRARIHVFPQLHARGIITFITKHQHCNVTGSSTASGHVVATVQVPENAAENLRKSYVTAYTFQFHGTMFSFFYPVLCFFILLPKFIRFVGFLLA